jgi:hypothetical protein
MQTKVKVQTVPYISTAHCTLAPYASAGVVLRSNADESRELYGTFGKNIVSLTRLLTMSLRGCSCSSPEAIPSLMWRLLRRQKPRAAARNDIMGS